MADDLPRGTWWIDEPLLAGSADPTPELLESLRQKGFAAIVRLLGAAPSYRVEAVRAAGFVWHAIPVPDFTAPGLEQMEAFVRLAECHGRRGEAVLVHCRAGKGRTGTMAAAYWIARGRNAGEAIAMVRERCPGAVETAEQENRLREFACTRS